MNTKKILLTFVYLAIFFMLLLQYSPVLANSSPARSEITIFFFWGDGCPHCAEEEPFLKSLVQKYPQVKIQDFEVWYDKQNQEILKKVAETMGFDPKGVPVTIIGDKVWIGFREEYKIEMENELVKCISNSCQSPITNAVPSTPVLPQISQNSNQIITLPFIGEVDLSKQSIAVSTLIIGFIDGFNPCSLWVISILLALTLTSGSRIKVITVGLTFLLVSTLVYSLFILGVFSLFSYIGYLKWIQMIVAVIAIAFGIVSMKDYFWFKQGMSFSISDKHKPALYKNMRDVAVTPRTLFGLISTTAVMAAGVSLIEFSCTAGFPVIWSNLMIANRVGVITFAFLLGLYMFLYLLDEMVLVITASITMKTIRMEEKHGRLLKLVSGTIMIALGLVMFFNPAIMNNLGTSLVVFLVALVFTFLVYFLHQKILPRMGIYIGNGLTKKRNGKKTKKS